MIFDQLWATRTTEETSFGQGIDLLSNQNLEILSKQWDWNILKNTFKDNRNRRSIWIKNGFIKKLLLKY